MTSQRTRWARASKGALRLGRVARGASGGVGIGAAGADPRAANWGDGLGPRGVAEGLDSSACLGAPDDDWQFLGGYRMD